MKKNRLEAFSDGVLAIIITIMVLEFNVPEGHTFKDLKPLLPKVLGYILSFIYIAIYWNNHHHLMHTVEKVNGKILWANMHLLFWLSLIPFTTAWIGESEFAPYPMFLYGIVLLGCAIAYYLLQKLIIKFEGKDSLIYSSVGKDNKGKLSNLLYIIAIAFALYIPIISGVIYIIVAFIWLVPDKRIEDNFTDKKQNK
ncbi:TMEM175 family protein [uncultured Flavobacterium sp.]|uniref:TMEM175 family protein n=1 Tax=uncultured Flavobacterium sp. TaxID=165435 RepID=UPI0030C80E34